MQKKTGKADTPTNGATWRQHTVKPVGKPKAVKPSGLPDRFLVETAFASQGYKLKITYAAKLTAITRRQIEYQPRGRVHPDDE